MTTPRAKIPGILEAIQEVLNTAFKSRKFKKLGWGPANIRVDNVGFTQPMASVNFGNGRILHVATEIKAMTISAVLIAVPTKKKRTKRDWVKKFPEQVEDVFDGEY